MEGLTLSGYNIGKQIGKGTNATVNRATKNSKKFALKHTRHINSDNHQIYGITNLQEIDILSRLSHEHIIHAVELIIPETKLGISNVAIVLPLFKRSLFGVLYNPNHTEENKIKNIFEVACALQFLHSHNILHLDVTPNNVLLDDEGKAILIDFGGSVYSVGGVTVMSRESVAPIYRSPESWKIKYGSDDIVYSVKDDMWSLGMMMLDCFCSKESIVRMRKGVFKNIERLNQGLLDTLKSELSDVGRECVEFLVVSDKRRDDVVEMICGLLDPDLNTRWSCDRLIKCNLFSEFVVPEGYVMPACIDASIIPSSFFQQIISITSVLLAKARVEMFFLAVDLLYRFAGCDVFSGKVHVLFYACIILAGSLADNHNDKSLNYYIKRISEKLDIGVVKRQSVARIQALVVKESGGVLYRNYVYQGCETLEQLKWCYINILSNSEKYSRYRRDDIPKIGGVVKSVSSSVDEMLRMDVN